MCDDLVGNRLLRGPKLQLAHYAHDLNDDIAEEKNLAASRGEKLQALSDLLDEWESEMSKSRIVF